MKNLKVPIFVACLCLIVAASSAPAEGFRFPNLNPFAKKKQQAPNYRFREPKSKSILPRISLLPKRDPNQPSTLQKINTGTKNFLAKTVDVLTPWDSGDDMPSRSPSVTGSRNPRNGGAHFSSRNPEPKKKNFLQRLVSWESDETETYDDVNDWLSQPRMQYR